MVAGLKKSLAAATRASNAARPAEVGATRRWRQESAAGLGATPPNRSALPLRSPRSQTSPSLARRPARSPRSGVPSLPDTCLTPRHEGGTAPGLSGIEKRSERRELVDRSNNSTSAPRVPSRLAERHRGRTNPGDGPTTGRTAIWAVSVPTVVTETAQVGAEARRRCITAAVPPETDRSIARVVS
jgi:hypothetical protein